MKKKMNQRILLAKLVAFMISSITNCSNNEENFNLESINSYKNFAKDSI